MKRKLSRIDLQAMEVCFGGGTEAQDRCAWEQRDLAHGWPPSAAGSAACDAAARQAHVYRPAPELFVVPGPAVRVDRPIRVRPGPRGGPRDPHDPRWR